MRLLHCIPTHDWLRKRKLKGTCEVHLVGYLGPNGVNYELERCEHTQTHTVPVSPWQPFQLPAGRSDLSLGSPSAAAARSDSKHRGISITSQIRSRHPRYTGLHRKGMPGLGGVTHLFDSSLVLGGPSLLAVVQLLQIALQVDHLLLRDEEFRKNKPSFRQPNSNVL